MQTVIKQSRVSRNAQRAIGKSANKRLEMVLENAEEAGCDWIRSEGWRSMAQEWLNQEQLNGRSRDYIKRSQRRIGTIEKVPILTVMSIKK
ncbi:hypothetical protein AMR42_05700 [Limnothrix sp. PR1529]|nr:hypothetical protein AMR42_05700 [Limnothrix sp. PR1529]